MLTIGSETNSSETPQVKNFQIIVSSTVNPKSNCIEFCTLRCRYQYSELLELTVMFELEEFRVVIFLLFSRFKLLSRNFIFMNRRSLNTSFILLEIANFMSYSLHSQFYHFRAKIVIIQVILILL